MVIETAGESDYQELAEVWESSVRATHDFLGEKDISFLRPLILGRYFEAVELRCVKDGKGKILGFCGVSHERLEMLFLSPEARGKGIGAALCRHAIDKMNIRKVDVNQQNPQAVGFYLHMGFRIVGRSPLDGQGMPFPLLHMELAAS